MKACEFCTAGKVTIKTETELTEIEKCNSCEGTGDHIPTLTEIAMLGVPVLESAYDQRYMRKIRQRARIVYRRNGTLHYRYRRARNARLYRHSEKAIMGGIESR